MANACKTLATRLVIGGMCMVASAVVSAADVVEVTGSGRDAQGLVSSLCLSFPATAKASSLWLAWGKSNAGEALGSWEELDFLAEVPAGATTCTCPVSVSPRHGGMTFARVFLLEDDTTLTELDGVTSPGNAAQYVDTAYVPCGTTSVLCDFTFSELKGSALFGVRTSTSENQFCLLELPNSNTGFRADYATLQYNTFSLPGQPVAGHRYVAEMDYTGLKIGGTFVNENAKTKLQKAQTVAPGKNLYLFAMNNNGAASSPAAATIHAFKAWDDTADRASLRIDLVPCRKDGVVGFYDRQNNRFLTPSGTLTAGAPKAHSSLGALSGRSPVLRPYGDGRGMTVSKIYRPRRSVVKVDLALDAALSDSTLVVAYAASDKGASLTDWIASDMTVAEGATVRILSTISGAATSYTATIPDVTDEEKMQVFRFFLISRFGGAAYDRLLDGVRATGTQYVQTDIVPTGTFSVQAQFSLVDPSVAQCLFGARTATGSAAFGLLHTPDQGLRYDYSTCIANTRENAGSGKFLCVMNSVGLDYTMDGGQTRRIATRPQTTPTTFTSAGRFAIFGLNTSGTVGSFAQAVCHRLWAWSVYGNDATRCLDLVPCVKNGKVGFYNKIGGGFLGNAGTGAFEAVEPKEGEAINADARVFAVSEAMALPSPPGLMLILR